MDNSLPLNWKLSPQSLQTVIEYATKASSLEIQTELKPGNVNPSQNMGNTTYPHFLQAIDAIQKCYYDTIILKIEPKTSQNSTFGPILYRTVDAMMNAQSGGNVLLGHILLFTPLLWTLQIWFNSKKSSETISWLQFWDMNEKTLHNATAEDGVWLSRAIARAQPGGLKNPGGKPIHSNFDFTRSDIEQQILMHGKTFLELYHESASFDSISAEMVSNYAICREILTDWVAKNQKTYQKSNEFIVDLFIYILSLKPDSLIFRKNSIDIANTIQNDAKKIIKSGGIRANEGKKRIIELNQQLNAANGKLNPGTTADLTACILFLGLLFNRLLI